MDRPATQSANSDVRVRRHRTALLRQEVSRPVRLALEDGIIHCDVTVFDFGCGRGSDVHLLSRQGIKCSGWDPAFRPHVPRAPADVVNLGYVVNVIENPTERIEALRGAWQLAEGVLIVSARLVNEMSGGRWASCGDGYLTQRETFQKFYEQQELREWIDASLGVQSIPAAPGVFYVFRDAAAEQTYLASRQRRRPSVPRVRISSHELLFEEHRALLVPLEAFFADRGRLPTDGELDVVAELRAALGSLRRASALIRASMGAEQWDGIARARAHDLLVYIALSRFGGRPSFQRLPLPLQLDIRAHFGTYKGACAAADELLFRVGDQAAVSHACAQSKIGKCTQEALYVHVDAVSALGPLLRVYEGCARAYVGSVDGANILKMHRQKPQVSYLAYPDFETDPHPPLRESLKVRFKGLQIEYRDYRNSDNPFILHRKETFVAPDHPLHLKFAKLTRQEEARGLLQRTQAIGTEQGWNAVLRQHGFKLRGHQLVRAQGYTI
jgi:DNA phosphorothioation-associated putative methyltransferase